MGADRSRHPQHDDGPAAGASTSQPASQSPTWRARLALVRSSLARLRRSTLPLRTLAPVEGAAPDWSAITGPAGSPVPAMALDSGQSVSYDVLVRPGAHVVAWCAATPAGQGQDPTPRVCECAVTLPATGWSARARLTVGARGRDDRWQRLVLPLAGVSGPTRATVRFSVEADVPATGSVRLADPRVEWPRTPREIWHSVVALSWRLRYSGLAATLRYVRDVQAEPEGDAGRYGRWLAARAVTPERAAALAATLDSLRTRPLISVLTPVWNTDPRWLRACIDSVRRQIYPEWELCLADDGSTSPGTLAVLRDYADDPRIRLVRLDSSGGVSAATNAALAEARGPFVALLDHDDELAPHALLDVARCLDENPDTDVVYSDEDKIDDAGVRRDPIFKPDWSPDYLRSTMYVCHLLVIRTTLVREVGGFRSRCDGAQDHDILLRVSERTSRIRHVPDVLYHWRTADGSTAQWIFSKSWAIDAGARAIEDHLARTGQDGIVSHGIVPGLYHARYRLRERPLVSIVIPSAGCTREVDGRHEFLLERCLRGIRTRTAYAPFEVLVVDSGLPTDLEARLAAWPHERVSVPGSTPFNFSERVNAGVSRAQGRYIVLLNDDVDVTSGDWLSALLEIAQLDGVGAVGAKLVYPDGRLQHAGIVTGVCGVAAHAFYRQPGGALGYGFSAAVVRNYSAVTAACLMTPKTVWDRLGGFDTRYALDFNDLDYCLRLRDAGFRVVYTPHATLTHFESASSGSRAWSAADVAAFEARWAGRVEHDPYYNRNLTRESPDFRVGIPG